MRLLLLLIAFSLSACSKIEVGDAEVTNPKEISTERIQFKTLNSEARKALNAMDPDALIAVLDESGVTFFGASGKAFKLASELASKEQPSREPSATSEIDEKKPVNNVTIRTFVNSPACTEVIGDGYRFWYPSGCPK